MRVPLTCDYCQEQRHKAVDLTTCLALLKLALFIRVSVGFLTFALSKLSAPQKRSVTKQLNWNLIALDVLEI